MSVYDDMLFRSELSVRYHRRRASFLERTSQLFTLGSVIGGASAFVVLIGGSDAIWAQIATLIVTVISLVQALYRIDAASAEHKVWLREWNRLLLEIKLNPQPSKEQIGQWMSKQIELESDCVGEMRALEADVWNRTAAALGYDDDPSPVKWYHRVFGQVYPFENSTFLPPSGDPAPPKLLN